MGGIGTQGFSGSFSFSGALDFFAMYSFAFSALVARMCSFMWKYKPLLQPVFQRLSGKSECVYLKLNEWKDIFSRLLRAFK